MKLPARILSLYSHWSCGVLLVVSASAFAQNAKQPAAHRSDTMKLGSVMLPSAFLDQVVRVTKSDGGALVFADPKGKLVIAERTGDRFNADFWIQDAFVLAARWVVDHGEPLVIEGGSSKVPDGLKAIPDYLQSYLGYPLKEGSKVFGVVNLVRMYGKDNFSEADMDVVALIVLQSADVVERLKEQSIKDLVQNREISAKTKVYFAPDESVIREQSISLELGLNFLLASTPIYVSDTINNQGMNIGRLPERISI
jgi:GAF domain-containing protein